MPQSNKEATQKTAQSNGLKPDFLKDVCDYVLQRNTAAYTHSSITHINTTVCDALATP